jgi:hypothetical protein
MNAHTSVLIDTKLVSNVGIALTPHTLVLCHSRNPFSIDFPLAAAHRASRVSSAGFGPRFKAHLVHVLSTRRLTPDDGLGAFGVKCTEANGAVTLDIFALPPLGFLRRPDRRRFCKDGLQFGAQECELVDEFVWGLKHPGQDLTRNQQIRSSLSRSTWSCIRI